MVNSMLAFQTVMTFIETLSIGTQTQLRRALLERFPTVVHDSLEAVRPQGKLKVSEFLSWFYQPRIIPMAFDPSKVPQTYALPPKPIYGPHLTLHKLVHGDSDADAPTRVTSAVFDVVRPWEALFHLFDPDLTGVANRYECIFALLGATSHCPILEPEALKYRSRDHNRVKCVLMFILGLLSERKQAEQVRLGEVFAIRDVLSAELHRERQLIKEISRIAPTVLSPKLIRRTNSANAVTLASRSSLQRLGEFGQKMVENKELLEAKQLFSLLIDIFIVGHE
jgi:hypothetical protein